IGAFLGAAVFAIHPIQVESVVWVSAFKYLIGAMFALLAIWQYLRFTTKRDLTSRGATNVMRPLYFGTAFYLLAVLSHPAMAVAPLVALIIERLLPSKSTLLRTRRPAWPLAVWLIL